MKHYASFALSMMLCLITVTGFSQINNSKPKQFGNFAPAINCSETELSKAFNTPAGQFLTLSFSNNFNFSGKVTSNIVKYSNLQTAVIVSPEYSNTIFVISRITNKDNSVSYVGHIVNKNYFDGFELKNVSGNYQLVKVETDRVIPDCKQQ